MTRWCEWFTAAALSLALATGTALAADPPKPAPAKPAPAKPHAPPPDKAADKVSGMQKAKRQVIEVTEGQTVSLGLPRRGWLYVTPPAGGRIFVDEAKVDPSIRVIYAGGEGLIFQHLGANEGKGRIKAHLPDGRSFRISVSVRQGATEYLYAVLR